MLFPKTVAVVFLVLYPLISGAARAVANSQGPVRPATAALVLPLPVTETKLTDPTPGGFDEFGRGVALSSDGTVALVGTPNEGCDAGFGCGAAYVFVQSGGSWVQTDRLVASDPRGGASFGVSVALSADGTRALVGAPRASAGPECLTNACGAAYVFVQSGGVWAQEAKLVIDDSGFSFGGTAFGLSVDLSDDGAVALAGAPFTFCSVGIGKDCGTAAVFQRTGSTWTLQQHLVPSVPGNFATFGIRVDLSNDGSTALIGAPSEACPVGFVTCGAAYVFAHGAGGWSEQARFAGTSGSSFGFDLALSGTGDRALVGKSATPCAAGASCGAADFFERSGGTWGLVQTLTATDAGSLQSFGNSLALSGDGLQALVGAPAGPFVGAGPGAVYLFRFTPQGTFAQQQKIIASDAAPGDGFGASTALSADGLTALVGAPSAPCSAGDDCGAAYVLQIVVPPGVIEVPTAGEVGLLTLVLMLSIAGALLLRRRSGLQA